MSPLAIGRLPSVETNPVSRGVPAQFAWLEFDTLAVKYTAAELYAIRNSHEPHNDVSTNDGPHIQRWSRKIII